MWRRKSRRRSCFSPPPPLGRRTNDRVKADGAGLPHGENVPSVKFSSDVNIEKGPGRRCGCAATCGAHGSSPLLSTSQSHVLTTLQVDPQQHSSFITGSWMRISFLAISRYGLRQAIHFGIRIMPNAALFFKSSQQGAEARGWMLLGGKLRIKVCPGL